MHNQLRQSGARPPRSRRRALATAVSALTATAVSGAAVALALPGGRAAPGYPTYPTYPTTTVTTVTTVTTTTAAPPAAPPGATTSTPADGRPAPAAPPQLVGPRNLGVAHVDRSGRFTVPRFRLICPLSSSSCAIVANDRGTLTNGQLSRTRHPTIANRRFSMRPGTQTSIAMRMQRGALAALHRRGRLRTTLSVSASDHGHDVRRTYRLRLR